jgi:hypothetical protein
VRSTSARDGRYFRGLNDRIATTAGDLRLPGDLPLVCECRDPRCFRLIRTSAAEFAALRDRPGRFAIFPGHEDVEAERLVDANDRFVLVDRI